MTGAVALGETCPVDATVAHSRSSIGRCSPWPSRPPCWSRSGRLELWWLWLLAMLYGLALLGTALHANGHRWLRLGIHGQGGACIALVTATFVVSVDGMTRIAAWALPTLIGVPLLELWYRRATATQRQVAQP